MLQLIRKTIRNNLFLRKLIGYYVAGSGFFDKRILTMPLSDYWQMRLKEARECPDNAYIPRVNDAGTVDSGKLVMHNGLRIYLGSYYGPEISQMLVDNKGVHEPQEERVFQEVLPTIPEGGVMIEMGAFWAFYSMWFQKSVTRATNYLIEPDSFNLGCGKRNFSLNGFNGHFTQAFIGKEPGKVDGNRVVSVDEIVAENNIEFVHMLHSDIQGFEYDMLQGASLTFEENKVGYVFISTHSPEVHQQCKDYLLERDFIILSDAGIEDSYSEDGLIAARAPHFPGIDPIDIALKTRDGLTPA